MLVIPASREVYTKAMDEGLLRTFVDFRGSCMQSMVVVHALGGHIGLVGPGGS